MFGEWSKAAADFTSVCPKRGAQRRRNLRAALASYFRRCRCTNGQIGQPTSTFQSKRQAAALRPICSKEYHFSINSVLAMGNVETSRLQWWLAVAGRPFRAQRCAPTGDGSTVGP
uniref:Uncharacterized protein n=1 Tax=Trichuris muris TaxID=70415 RepID=A0A5S6Q6V5_TRIMR